MQLQRIDYSIPVRQAAAVHRYLSVTVALIRQRPQNEREKYGKGSDPEAHPRGCREAPRRERGVREL